MQIRQWLGCVCVVVASGLGSVALAQSVPCTAYVVNSTADDCHTASGDGCDCSVATDKCTLRAAVLAANALTVCATIAVPAGTYTLTGAAHDDDGASGDIDFNGSHTITVTGANRADSSGGRNGVMFKRTYQLVERFGRGLPIERLAGAAVERSGD